MTKEYKYLTVILQLKGIVISISVEILGQFQKYIKALATNSQMEMQSKKIQIIIILEQAKYKNIDKIPICADIYEVSGRTLCCCIY